MKKFDHHMFVKMTTPTQCELVKRLKRLKQNKTSRLWRLIVDIEGVDSREATRRLDVISRDIGLWALFFTDEMATSLWRLIQISANGCPDEENLSIIKFLGVTKCGLLRDSEVGARIHDWKIARISIYLKELKKVVSPGNETKIYGGRSRKLPQSLCDESFVRIHEKKRRNDSLSLNGAAKRVADEMKQNHDVLSRKYKETLKHLKTFYSEKQIDDIVKASLC